MKNSTRVVFNSLVLYGRLVITTIIKLLITKLLVKYLGLEGFGLYNLLSGIVVMLSFFKATLASTSQRFLSVSMGKGNSEDTKEMYYLLNVLHVAMGFIVMLFVDVVGVILVQTVLNIPIGQENVAVILIHTMALSTAVTIITVPNDSLLIARENILVLSLFVILESLLNLGAVVALGWIEMADRLTWYALMSVVYLFVVFVGRCFYVRRYPETHVKVHKVTDFSILKEISKYTGWSTICSLFYLLRNQGYSIMFNIFGGVLINSAYGIGNQVNGLVTYATEAITQPLRPQIMKTESSGNRDKSLAMMVFASKSIVALLICIIAPLIVFIDDILLLWIIDVPYYAPHFCRILLISAFVFAFSNSMKALIEAVGQVKQLFSVIGYLHLAALLVSIVVLWITDSVVIAYSVVVVEELIGSLYRIYLSKVIMNYNIKRYFIDCVLKGCIFLILAIVSLYAFSFIIEGILLEIGVSIVIMLLLLLLYYIAVFNDAEKNIIKRIVHL